jgi:hypothetical protein
MVKYFLAEICAKSIQALYNQSVSRVGKHCKQ